MYKLSKTRIYIILAICLAGIFFAVPNVIGDKTKLPKWWRPVNLGLDLQGGSNLLLQVKVDDVIRERMGQVEDDARQVLRENKIRYQNLKAGADNVTVIERTGTNAEEVTLAAQALVADGVDAVFTPTDNTIMKSELSIYEIFADAKIPQYAGADSIALNGAFLGYGVDYAKLGVETANMIIDIMINGKDPATTPVLMFDNGTATINTEICAKLGYNFDEVSKLFAPKCTEVKSITTAESFDDVK